MKNALVSLAIVLTGIPAAVAQTTPATTAASTARPTATSSAAPSTTHRSAAAEPALLQMEKDILAAVIKRDTAALGPFFNDDFVATLPDGTTQTKAEFLAGLKAGDLVIGSSEMDDTKVRVYGDAAVVTYASTDKGTYKGADIGGRYRWTDTFVRRGGKWQIVASHGTPIARP